MNFNLKKTNNVSEIRTLAEINIFFYIISTEFMLRWRTIIKHI